MDFADDFTYFTLNDVVEEAKRLFGHHRYVADIRLEQAANDEPALAIRLKTDTDLSLKQLGLPVQFRRLKTKLVAANDGH
jgi:hypothetical protein